MRAIVTEVVISLSPENETGGGTIFDQEQVVVKLMDEAAGAYLQISGRTAHADRPEDGDRSFCLDKTEIDDFASILRRVVGGWK